MIIVSFHAWLLFPSMHDYYFLPWMIVFFHAWLLFPSMYVASGDRFVSFKAGGDRMNGSFFFYRAGYRMVGREEQPKKKSHQKNSLTFSLFSCRRYARTICSWTVKKTLALHASAYDDVTPTQRTLVLPPLIPTTTGAILRRDDIWNR